MVVLLQVQLVDRVTTMTDISHLYRNHRDSMSEEKLRRSECWTPI